MKPTQSFIPHPIMLALAAGLSALGIGLGVASESRHALSEDQAVDLHEVFAAAQPDLLADLYAFRPGDDGYEARNLAQGWRMAFDGRGFTAQPAKGAWSWGLELQRYGFEGHEREIDGKARVGAEGQRLTYAWNQDLEEWFINDARGLEHGFTLGERPPGAETGGPLVFEIGVRGGLHPEVVSDSGDVCFTNKEGDCVLTYAGLKVWDADGFMLEAAFAADEQWKSRTPILYEAGSGGCLPFSASLPERSPINNRNGGLAGT